MTRHWNARWRVGLVIALGAALGLTLYARQEADVDDLRAQLRERYDVLALQDGVGLVPRQPIADVRTIEVRDGAVSINGETMTGGELRDRLGDAAELILRITYLDATDQRRLGDAAAPEPGAAPAVQPPAAPDAGATSRVTRRVRRNGVTRIMGNVTVARGERVEGDVIVVMGDAYIDGEVDGDVNVVMGNAYFGPESLVTDDVSVVAGTVNRASGSRIEGTLDNVDIGSGPWPAWNVGGMLRDTIVGRLGSLAGTLLRVALLALLALVVVAFGRTTAEQIADRMANDPVRAGLVGFLAQLLFCPLLVITIVVLAVSIVGIPLLMLLPFALFLVLVVLLVGFTGVAYQVGRWLNARAGWTDRSAYVTVLLGVLLIAAVTIVARSAAVAGGALFTFPLSAAGYVVEYVAWTLGFGAAILAWLQRGKAAPVPPPLPAP